MVKFVDVGKLYATVDDSDYELVSQHRWNPMPSNSRRENHYAVAFINGQSITMHRFLLGADHGQHVDHADGDGLNNTRANIRFCTPSQNNANRLDVTARSGYRGVYRRSRNRWEASIGFDRETIRIGRFPTPEEAARAYDAKARELFGQFARLNFPESAIS